MPLKAKIPHCLIFDLFGEYILTHLHKIVKRFCKILRFDGVEVRILYISTERDEISQNASKIRCMRMKSAAAIEKAIEKRG